MQNAIPCSHFQLDGELLDAVAHARLAVHLRPVLYPQKLKGNKRSSHLELDGGLLDVVAHARLAVHLRLLVGAALALAKQAVRVGAVAVELVRRLVLAARAAHLPAGRRDISECRDKTAVLAEAHALRG